MVETPDDGTQDTSSSQAPETPNVASNARPRAQAATRSNNARRRPMSIARGRGAGRTPGSHYFGAGGQYYTGRHGPGGRNSRATPPDGRTHLIPRSVRNTPPQQTVRERYIPGVSTGIQTQLSRRMAATNLATSLPTNWLVAGDIPSHTGVREDGTFEGLDGNANSRAMVPYDARPDPVVSQQSIVATTPRDSATGTITVRQASYGLRTSASNFIRRTSEESPALQIFTREDGTIYGPGVDGKDEDNAMVVHQDAPQDAGSTVPQGDPQGTDLNDGVIVDPNRGAIDPPATTTGTPTVKYLVSTDTLLDSTDPRHQPGSIRAVTVYHPTPGSLQEPVVDPQDDDQNRGAQVDPQPIPATDSNVSTSMQDIDEDDDNEVHNQTQVPEIPANWKPAAPPTLSYISQELGNDADTSSQEIVPQRSPSPVFDADGLLVEENHGNQPYPPTFSNREPDTSSLGLIVWKEPVFDDEGLLIEDDRENQSSQQTSQQGDPKEDPSGDDSKPPASDPLSSNPFAPLAEDSDDEDPNTDTSRPDNTSSTEDHEPRTYASVASSSSGSGDGNDQPDISTLTKLPDTGMRQRRATATGTTPSNKRDRTPKAKRAPKDQATATPSTVASIARNVCTDMLSPFMGDTYVHCSSDDASPTNSNDSKADESKTAGTPKSPDTDIHIQSSSSSSHQPPASRTRLARSTSREREARLAAENQRVTRSRSAERTNTPAQQGSASTPQTAQRNLTPNARGRPRPGRGKGKSKNNKRLDFR